MNDNFDTPDVPDTPDAPRATDEIPGWNNPAKNFNKVLGSLLEAGGQLPVSGVVGLMCRTDPGTGDDAIVSVIANAVELGEHWTGSLIEAMPSIAEAGTETLKLLIIDSVDAESLDRNAIKAAAEIGAASRDNGITAEVYVTSGRNGQPIAAYSTSDDAKMTHMPIGRIIGTIDLIAAPGTAFDDYGADDVDPQLTRAVASDTVSALPGLISELHTKRQLIDDDPRAITHVDILETKNALYAWVNAVEDFRTSRAEGWIPTFDDAAAHLETNDEAERTLHYPAGNNISRETYAGALADDDLDAGLALVLATIARLANYEGHAAEIAGLRILAAAICARLGYDEHFKALAFLAIGDLDDDEKEPMTKLLDFLVRSDSDRSTYAEAIASAGRANYQLTRMTDQAYLKHIVNTNAAGNAAGANTADSGDRG